MSELKAMSLDGPVCKHELPVWRKLRETATDELWEIQLYSHQLIGAASVQILWLKKECSGSMSVYRNNEFLVSLPMDRIHEAPRNVDEFKDQAWERVLDFATHASVYLQKYIAWALKQNPLSEDVAK